MGKFTGAPPPAATSPVRSTGVTVINHEGGTGHLRDPKSDLFLLAVTNMVAEGTFYEPAGDRDARFRDLIAAVVGADPGWVARFVPYLRAEMGMRSAAVVMAAEYALALRDLPVPAREAAPSPRAVIAGALQRPDEPAEFIAYWRARTGQRNIGGGVQRGVADAVARLYTERAALKYDGTNQPWRMGDVVDVVHPTPAGPWQAALFRYLLDRRHNRAEPRLDAELLPVIAANTALQAIPAGERAAWLAGPTAVDGLRAAGVTWESLSGWLGGPMGAVAWSAVIPSMGLMALVRNLRNFDQAGVPDDVARFVADRLSDPEQVRASRMFPFRFLAAYRAAPSLRWGHPLQKALTASIANVPRLAGRTLVLVDTSTSMNEAFSKDGTVMRWDAAATFGVAVGQRCETADVVSFSSSQRSWNDPLGARTKVFPLKPGEDLLRSLDRWKGDGFFLGGGTDTPGAVRAHYAGHDRVVIVTDEQHGVDPRSVSDAVPANVPLYTWNLAGYEAGHAPAGTGNRHTFGGLTDAAFKMIPMLEARHSQTWPF